MSSGVEFSDCMQIPRQGQFFGSSLALDGTTAGVSFFEGSCCATVCCLLQTKGTSRNSKKLNNLISWLFLMMRDDIAK